MVSVVSVVVSEVSVVVSVVSVVVSVVSVVVSVVSVVVSEVSVVVSSVVSVVVSVVSVVVSSVVSVVVSAGPQKMMWLMPLSPASYAPDPLLSAHTVSPALASAKRVLTWPGADCSEPALTITRS